MGPLSGIPELDDADTAFKLSDSGLVDLQASRGVSVRPRDLVDEPIEGRVNLAQAWGSLAIFRLLVREPFGALDALAHLLDFCEQTAGSPKRLPCAGGRSLARLRATLGHLRSIPGKLEGLDWLERAVLVGLAVRVGDSAVLDELRALASRGKKAPAFSPGDRIVILAGGCAAEVEPLMPPFREALAKAVEGLSLTLVSGGTHMGVSGIAAELARCSQGRIRAVGYLPLPMLKAATEAGRDDGFDPVFTTTGADFTPLDPLQSWTDLIAAGVNPAGVKLIAYGGRSISRVEIAMALALGARVGVVENKRLPKDRQFDDPGWTTHRNFLPLRLDAMTLHAFIRHGDGDLSDADENRLECAARYPGKS